MEPVEKVAGVAMPMDRQNVDTDAIVPARFLRRIERTGWGEVLFNDWRSNEDGTPNPSFVLNEPRYEDAKIIIAGKNFGSGSSREHAVWAIRQYGFRAVIASSIADIFHKNCFENGVIPVLIPEEDVQMLMRRAKEGPPLELTVDLKACVVTDGANVRIPFLVHSEPETHGFRRETLMKGYDEIALTLRREDDVTAFEETRPAYMDPAGVS
ncbi:MAG TPA: 3-isopropylmalate dehydratase small subunit [Dehalococcoidia bacterium]|nr:3-isopropylmalate dehydratase small subunit [Dehalococcoidia bacterium]